MIICLSLQDSVRIHLDENEPDKEGYDQELDIQGNLANERKSRLE